MLIIGRSGAGLKKRGVGGGGGGSYWGGGMAFLLLSLDWSGGQTITLISSYKRKIISCRVRSDQI